MSPPNGLNIGIAVLTNPSAGCPADTALGMAIDVDFTQGEVNSFTASGGTPEYGADGVTFTVAKSGDAPQLTSVFYIMFGRVEITMKCAPGAGIVSSFVLQSDDLDEIDMEWLGADDATVQTNYFGKGQTGAFDRGQFNPAANNQADYITYAVDWTSDRLVWYVGDTAVRTLTFDDANGQYPQTPMQVKFGAWSGGDSANAAGTISWARGPTDYSQGPFTMAVKSVKVTDYSTGKEYQYGDTSGSWTSIVAVDGEVNANVDAAPTVSAVSGAATSLSPSIPAGGIGQGSSTATAVASSNPIPSGWRMTSEGKIVPASSTVVSTFTKIISCAPFLASEQFSRARPYEQHANIDLSLQNLPTLSSSPAPLPSSSSALPSAAGGDVVITTYDDRGFLTTMTVPAGWETRVKSYDDKGFLITPTASTPQATAAPPLMQAEATGNAGSGIKAGSHSAAPRLSSWLLLQSALSLAVCLRLVV